MGHPTKDRRITLERIESYLPERSVRIEELGERLGLHRAQLGVFRKFYGLDTLRFDPELPLLDLLRPAARAALEALPEDGRVDYLAYAHTTQAVAPPDVDIAQVVGASAGPARRRGLRLRPPTKQPKGRREHDDDGRVPDHQAGLRRGRDRPGDLGAAGDLGGRLPARRRRPATTCRSNSPSPRPAPSPASSRT
ncbi:hypothetical protein SMICM17S_00426 [Streptomyces microflavus]